MLILVLGKGKTGSLVAEVARERGHGVRALDINENLHASALTAPNLAGVDVVIDFTAPEAAVENMRAVLALGGRIVVGTTGWYAQLNEMKALAQKRGGGLLYGTNFSIGVQKLFRLTAELAKLDGYSFSIDETHHVIQARRAFRHGAHAEGDHPGGAAGHRRCEITSHRVGDAKGEHIVHAASETTRSSCATTPTAAAALRWARCAARSGWPARSGAWEFREIFDEL